MSRSGHLGVGLGTSCSRPFLPTSRDSPALAANTSTELKMSAPASSFPSEEHSPLAYCLITGRGELSKDCVLKQGWAKSLMGDL